MGAAKAPKPAFPNDTSHWHSTSVRPKASTPARTWSDIACCGGKSSKNSKKALTLTPPPELSLQNRHNPLTLNEMSNNTKHIEPREANHTTSIKTNQNPRNSPRNTASSRARRNIANSTPDKRDTTLIGDSTTKHVRKANMENLTMADNLSDSEQSSCQLSSLHIQVI